MFKQIPMKNQKNSKKVEKLNLRVNIFLFLSCIVVWFYVTIIKTNYFSYMPLPFTPTGLFENLELKFSLEKISFLFFSFLVGIVVFLAGYGYGSFILNKFFKFLNTNEKVVLSFVLGCGNLALIVFFVSLVGLIYKTTFLLLVVVGVFLLYFFGKEIFQNIHLPKFSFFQLILFIIFIYTALINLLGSLTPETFFDSQFYLLGVLNQWKLEHRMVFIPYIASSLYPFNVNMLYLVAMVLGNDISAKIVHWLCGIICCYGIYVFVKKYFSKITALIAVLIFYTVPTLMSVSWKTAIELGISMFEIGMIFCMLEYISSKNKKFLVLSGLCGGFAIGSKYIALLEFFAISVIFFIYKLFKEKEQKVLEEFSYFLVPAVVVASVWYFRNLILTGNPVFPFFASKIGSFKPRVVGNIFADPPFPKFSFKNYFLFLWPLSLGQLQQESYPGGVFLFFLPLLVMFKNIDYKIKFLIKYFLICLILWIFLGRFYLRYFIPVISVAAVIYAYFISENTLPQWIKNLIYVIFIFVICSNVNFSIRILHFTQMPSHFVFGDMTKEEYLSTQRPSYPSPYYQVVNWLNKNLPEDSKILILGDTRGLFYERKCLTSGVLEYSPLVEMLKKCNSSEELYDLFKKEKITHILLNVPEAKRLSGYDNFYFEKKELKVWCEFWKKHVKEIYKDIADIALPERGVVSIKKINPGWWELYSSEPTNYVYLYEVVPELTKPSYNFFLHKEIYSSERWEKLKDFIEEFKKLPNS